MNEREMKKQKTARKIYYLKDVKRGEDFREHSISNFQDKTDDKNIKFLDEFDKKINTAK